MGGNNDQMEDLRAAMAATLLNKIIDFLKNKELEAHKIAPKLLGQVFNIQAIASATTLTATSHSASKYFTKNVAKYIQQLRRRHPNPRLTQKRRTQVAVSYLHALQAYFGSWDQIEKVTLLDGLRKSPLTTFPEELKQFYQDSQEEDD